MFTALVIAASLASHAPAMDPPTQSRQAQCWDMYDLCRNEAWDDYTADAITGAELVVRWQACTDWLFECMDLADILDAIDNQVPIVPGTIVFPPPFGD